MYSVIIPARNEGANLWYTLHSIRMIWDQWPDDEEHELIVVDNRSTDGTRAFLEDASMKWWVRRVESVQTGPGPARQAGAAVARGDILFFVDGHVLLSADFFRKACRALRRVRNRVGCMHFPIAWNGSVGTARGTHYTLTLEKDFWGVHTLGDFTRMTEIAVMTHACFAVRRDRFFEVGGFRAPMADYGGEECYLDLKFARFGFRNYCYPGVYFLHCTQREYRFPWNGDTLLRNNLMAAHIVGGPDWAARVRDYRLRNTAHEPATVHDLYREAAELGAEEHAALNARATLTLDEVLAGFRQRGAAH